MSNDSSTTKVLFIWQPGEQLKDYFTKGLNHHPVIDLIFPENVDETSLLKYASQADIIIGWRPTSPLLEKAERVKLFINPGAGVQHQIDVFRELSKSRPVTLVNGHGNSYFTAQHAVAMLLTLMNKVIPHHNWMRKGQWRKGDKDAISIPLRNRTIGLLGYGAVNRKVHRFLSGFDVRFAVLRRDWSKQTESLPTETIRFEPDNLDEFLKLIDILIITLPQTGETIGMIGGNELRLLGSDGLLVNVGRGVVVDEESLYNTLRERIIAGAAIDVWYNYRPKPDTKDRKYPFNYPFHELDNIVLSPHRAASPFNDLRRWDEVIENIARFADGRTDFINVVDLERGY